MARKSSGLGPWLATLDSDQLLALLRARPDGALPPEPGNPSELAARLSTAHSVQRALGLLTLPALQAAEALLALGGQAPHAELASLLGVASGGARSALLDDALAELGRLALVWPLGRELRLVGSMRELIRDPLRLGSPARHLFSQLTVAQLERIGSTLGLGGIGRKAQWVDAVADAASDPGSVAARLAGARPELVEAVERIAWHGPRVGGARLPRAYERADPNAVGLQLAVQGWVVAGEWGEVGEMPCEVALAVRGPDYRAPFDAPPPLPATAPVAADRLHEASRHAAGAAVDAVRRFVALVDRSPIDRLQAGGVGVRELRRVAKQLGGRDEAAVRLWLEIGVAAGLVSPSRSHEVLATPAVDDWLEADPADALATLLAAWWVLPTVPGHHLDDAGKAAPALSWSFVAPDGIPVRADLLAELATLTGRPEANGEPVRGLADPGDLTALVERLAHRRPIAHGRPEVLAPRLRATLTEATLLGLVADGALTPLGFRFLDAVATPEPERVLAQAAAGLLPAPSTTAVFLPDLTVVVGGAVGAGLSRLLDDAADAESRDTASTWRFSPASVRRALDGGQTADSLLAELAAVAENALPQPLEYLVRDVARRHGELQVVPAACCVVVADRALAAEVAAHRTLAALQLTLLDGAVLASRKNPTETVAALRAAGYAPVRRDAAGATVIDRAPVRRTTPRDTRMPPIPGTRAGLEPADLSALAHRLAGGQRSPTPVPAPADSGPEVTAVDAPALTPSEVAVLDFAVRHRLPVEIDYVNTEGNLTTRVIEPTLRLGGMLVARCRLRQAERNFTLSRITAASPVDG